MSPFKDKTTPRIIDVPQIEFIGEQDGPAERELKAALVDIFKNNSAVLKAYLAIAEYADGTVNVVLGLKSAAKSETEIAQRVHAAFSAIFNRHMHLDILFLDPAREASIAKVCKSFFET